jgi:hypothetical protein
MNTTPVTLDDTMNQIDCVRIRSGWDLYHEDDYIGFFLDGELAELKLARPEFTYRIFPLL